MTYHRRLPARCQPHPNHPTKAAKVSDPEDLKIPVSAVRFCLWALGKQGKAGVSGCLRRLSNLRRLLSGCQPVASRLPALALGLSLMGCGEHVVVFHGDTSFTPEERSQIQRGADLLSEHMHESTIEVVWDLPPGTPPPQLSITKKLLRAPEDRGVVGYCDGNRVLIDVEKVRMTGPPDGSLVFAAAHELGHYWGLDHHESPDGIMAGYLSPRSVPAWSAADQAECKRIGRC